MFRPQSSHHQAVFIKGVKKKRKLYISPYLRLQMHKCVWIWFNKICVKTDDVLVIAQETVRRRAT